MIDITKLRYYVQKVLPLVYDDSLSYYELLCKVVSKINELVDASTEMGVDIDSLISQVEDIDNKVDGLINNLVDVIVPWNSELEYGIYRIVEYQGNNYIAIRDVPVGIMITNTDYWAEADTTVEQLNAISVSVSEINDTVEKLSNYVTPQMFGAVADGVTDDYSAIVQAINSGKDVYFPEGRYYVSDTVHVSNHVSLIGAGAISHRSDATTEIIGNYASDKYIIDSTSTSTSKIHAKNITFVGYCFDNVYFGLFENCTFIGYDYTNVHATVDNRHGIGFNNLRVGEIRDCVFHHMAYGIKNCQDTRVTGSVFYENSISCAQDAYNDNQFNGNRFEWSYIGLSLNGNNSVINDNIFDRNSYGIYCAGACNRVVIANNMFERNLINHIWAWFGAAIIACNVFRAGIENDDGTGDTVPVNAIHCRTLVNGTIITNNSVQQSKFFDSSYNSYANTVRFNNITPQRDGTYATEDSIVVLGEVTPADNSSHNYSFNFANVPYMRSNGYDFFCENVYATTGLNDFSVNNVIPCTFTKTSNGISAIFAGTANTTYKVVAKLKLMSFIGYYGSLS